MDYQSASDEAVVERLRQRDPRALETLYDRYSRPVYSLALRILHDRALAEEIVQEVFLKLWRQPERYSAERGRFAPWLLSVTHHRAIDELRTSQADLRFGSGELPVGFELRNSEVDPAEVTWYREEQEQVRDALVQLPDSQRRVIELAYFGGLTQAQIAALTGEPLGTVKTRIRLGMQKLRTILSGQLLGLEGHVDS